MIGQDADTSAYGRSAGRRQARYALSGPVPGASPVVCHPSDRAPFPPRPPPPLLAGLFGRFIGTTRLVRPLACSTAASAPHLPAAARDRCARLRARRGLPGSDAFLSCVMGSLTTAERQPLAYRDRTCCLRRFLPARPLRFFGFRGSITHPTRSLCTLRDRRRRRPRNTRYRAPATAYPRRSSTGRTAPACLAHRNSKSIQPSQRPNSRSPAAKPRRAEEFQTRHIAATIMRRGVLRPVVPPLAGIEDVARPRSTVQGPGSVE